MCLMIFTDRSREITAFANLILHGWLITTDRSPLAWEWYYFYFVDSSTKQQDAQT